MKRAFISVLGLTFLAVAAVSATSPLVQWNYCSEKFDVDVFINELKNVIINSQDVR